jgi:hypothetical protein
MGTTVLERRSGSRRSSRSWSPPDHPERRAGGERREYVPKHHITVGHVDGSEGWMGGVCSCGEHTLSRIDGLIEEWANWHRGQVTAERSVFVHSS